MFPAFPTRWFWRRPIHVSLIITCICIGFITGIAAARGVPVGMFASVSWLCVAISLGVVSLWRRRYWVVGLALVAGITGGLWRGSLTRADTAQYAPVYGHVVTLDGTIREDPDAGGGGMVLKLNGIKIDGNRYGGSAWISVGTRDIKRSDHVAVTGKLGEGFGTFAGTMYRATVVSVTRETAADPARDIRDWFAGKVRGAVSEPGASLGIGYLVGQKSALPASLADALVIAGLTHIVVASGYNLTVLVRLARRLFMKVSRYAAALAAGGMVLAFMAVTGLSPSMSRAGLVAGVSLLAWFYGRSVHPLVLLPFAAAVTLLVNPSYLWGDLGWALSFGSFAGVMLLAPLLQAYFFGEAKPGIIRQILGETIAAQIATLPILVLAFGQFSNVSLLANILVLPLVPLAMLLTFIAGLSAIFVPSFAHWIGLPADLLLHYMTAVATYLAGLDWATSIVSITPLTVVIAYVLLAAITVYLARVTRTRLTGENLIV